MRLVALAAIFWLLADQFSKWFVVHFLELKTRYAIDVLPPILNFRMGWNTGINFGLFSNSPAFAQYFLVAVALVISAGIAFWAYRSMTRSVTLIGAGSIIGGALGNSIDRVYYGAVADFLNMSCCGIDNPFAFNVADIGIFLGAFLLIAFDDTRTT